MARSTFCQSPYEGLHALPGVEQSVFHSENAKDRALAIHANVAKAEVYFHQAFKVRPTYTLMVLSPEDWRKHAHPKAVYGIPHYLPDGRLVVAAENNDFWKRNTPPLEALPIELADRFRQVYAAGDGEVALTAFFDLLAIHELGHAFQSAAGMLKQRNWLNELLCNVLLHAFVAENEPGLLPALTVYPLAIAVGFPPERLKYVALEDFDTHYSVLAQEHPDNYGWYQCRFHVVAGRIHDQGGAEAMQALWNILLEQQEKLGDVELERVLKTSHPAWGQAISDWH